MASSLMINTFIIFNPERIYMSKNQTNQETQIPNISEKIVDQILTVRDTGGTNMFDVSMVQRIAFELDLFELVDFLTENKNVYLEFILHGKR